mmetsp:Transcript_4226/g.8592  ORF Transcript_4226/g.8592 Transcript_4226/m.8592 type:complete len:213 (+) Transcript_4226:81-719(+)
MPLVAASGVRHITNTMVPYPVRFLVRYGTTPTLQDQRRCRLIFFLRLCLYLFHGPLFPFPSAQVATRLPVVLLMLLLQTLPPHVPPSWWRPLNAPWLPPDCRLCPGLAVPAPPPNWLPHKVDIWIVPVLCSIDFYCTDRMSRILDTWHKHASRPNDRCCRRRQQLRMSCCWQKQRLHVFWLPPRVPPSRQPGRIVCILMDLQFCDTSLVPFY